MFTPGCSGYLTREAFARRTGVQGSGRRAGVLHSRSTNRGNKDAGVQAGGREGVWVGWRAQLPGLVGVLARKRAGALAPRRTNT